MIEPLVISKYPPRHFVQRAVLYAVLFAVAVAPTLPLLQFCRTPENLVIAAALEMKRSGNWLEPTLEGEPRTAKPPLATWITAAAIWSSTMQAMSADTEPLRAHAARWLAWETRWPAVLIAVCTLLATAELGRMLIGDLEGGIASMLLCGSGFLFLRFATEASTDTSLMLSVTIANVLLFRAVILQEFWMGFIGAGVAVGLALMSKGPVALIQTILPFGLFVLWQRPAGARPAGALPRQWIVPAVVGLICLLGIALPWPMLLLLKNPSGQWHEWMTQLSGQDAPDRRDPIWSYPVRLLEAAAPCVILLIAGMWRGWRSKRPGLLLALLLLLVPIVIMTFFKDRKDRYLLPMMPAAAVLCAAALTYGKRKDAVEWLHWIAVILVAIGLPIFGATSLLQGIDGRPWLSPAFAASAAALVSVILFTAWKVRCSLPVMTFAVMLLVQFVFVIGYGRSDGGQSDMLPLALQIWRVAPDAEMINGQPTDIRTSVDLSIYMNRITRWMPTEQWHALRPTNRTRVVILLQHPGEPPPKVEGWQTLASIPHGKEQWWALMMPRI